MDTGRDLETIRQLLQNARATHETKAETLPPQVKQRVVGAALFGFLVGGYAQNAAQQTVPVIMSMIQKIDVEAAKAIYDDSPFYRSSVLIISAFLGAAIASFLARRKWILAGLLSSSLYILGTAYVLFVSIAPEYSAMFSRWPLAEDVARDTSVQFQVLLRLVLFTLAALAGGFVGHKLYAPEMDLDLGQPRLTIFGIRWPHYFWILPFIYLAFLASAVMTLYAGITVLWADLAFAWHPSIWFDFAWNWGFPVGPILVWIAAWMTGAGFVRFYQVMQFRQVDFRGWRKAGRVLLYGVGAPALSYTIGALGADVAHAMPKPAEGDWKVAVAIMTVLFAISGVVSTIARIRAKRAA